MFVVRRTRPALHLPKRQKRINSSLNPFFHDIRLMLFSTASSPCHSSCEAHADCPLFASFPWPGQCSWRGGRGPHFIFQNSKNALFSIKSFSSADNRPLLLFGLCRTNCTLLLSVFFLLPHPYMNQYSSDSYCFFLQYRAFASCLLP